MGLIRWSFALSHSLSLSRALVLPPGKERAAAAAAGGQSCAPPFFSCLGGVAAAADPLYTESERRSSLHLSLVHILTRFFLARVMLTFSEADVSVGTEPVGWGISHWVPRESGCNPSFMERPICKRRSRALVPRVRRESVE